MAKYSLTLGQLGAFARGRDIDEALLREWCQSWIRRPGTHQLRLAILKAFFRLARGKPQAAA